MLKVLFLCTGNSCRSQMAEGWARHLKGDRIEAYSAGIEAHGLNPDAVRVMAEAGVDISGQRSKRWSELGDVDVRLRRDRLRPRPRVVPGVSGQGQGRSTSGSTIRRAWRPTPRPRTERLAPYRRVRDEIRAFVETLPDVAPTTSTTQRVSHEQSGRASRQTVLPRSLPHALDFPGDGRRRRAGILRAGRRGVHQPLPGRHDQHPHRHRADPDDVPAAGQGEVRGTGRRLPRLEGARRCRWCRTGSSGRS